MTGKILWIDKRDGNGIIKDSKGYEYYFDTSVTKDFNNLKDSDTVEFIVNDLIKHCRCAKQVKVING